MSARPGFTWTAVARWMACHDEDQRYSAIAVCPKSSVARAAVALLVERA